jgi:16S rRNA (guanine527-N7)-methyltransferase
LPTLLTMQFNINSSDVYLFSQKYFEILNGKFKGINLTRITDFDSFYLKQIIDSYMPLVQSLSFRNSILQADRIYDVGFGGGFPLLVLAYIFPNKKFIGIESIAKKARVVSEIANELGISNVSFIHSNLKNLFFDHEKSLITFKAVGVVKEYLAMINSDKPLDVYFYKGPNFIELEGNPLTETYTCWDEICLDPIEIETLEGRYIYGVRKKNVPRGTISKFKNDLVKV